MRGRWYQRFNRTAKVRPFIRFPHTGRNRGLRIPRLLTVFEKNLIHHHGGISTLPSISSSSTISTRSSLTSVNSLDTTSYFLISFLQLDSNDLPYDHSPLIPLNHLVMFILRLSEIVYLICIEKLSDFDRYISFADGLLWVQRILKTFANFAIFQTSRDPRNDDRLCFLYLEDFYLSPIYMVSDVWIKNLPWWMLQLKKNVHLLESY